MKLYRYRPLSEILFKELLYSEVYLASPIELNDPLDLNGQLDFFSENKAEINRLVHFLSKQMGVLLLSDDNYVLAAKLMHPIVYEQLGTYITADFSNRDTHIVTTKDLFEILSRFYRENPYAIEGLEEFKAENLFSTLETLFAQFLNNSSVACFSQNYNNFLMWSHYASGHTGICLEFEVDADPESSNTCHFPFISNAPFEGKYIEWMEDINMVRYSASLTKPKFYDYMLIFDNEGDVDLMTISKSFWKQYAHGVKNLFLEKLAPWSEESEWRIVHVSFQETMPEDRILKFNSSALTGVYFGAKSSKQTQERVRNITEKGNSNPVFYKCNVDGTRGYSGDITHISLGKGKLMF